MADENNGDISWRNHESERVTDIGAQVAAMKQRLENVGREGVRRSTFGSRISIYRVPHNLCGISLNAIQPEIVSIGPYHHGKDELQEFECYKWQFLQSLLFRTESLQGLDMLPYYMQAVSELEIVARECYSEYIPMSSADFVQMMVLDGCFIVELMLQFCESENFPNPSRPLFTMPWSISLIIRDLLKLENQIPFFVLQTLYDLARGKPHHPLPRFAFKFLNLALPGSLKSHKVSCNPESKHLLDLFHYGFLPTTQKEFERKHMGDMFLFSIPRSTTHASPEHRPVSDQSIQCVTRLRASGMKFRPRRTNNFLDINFQDEKLGIPPMTINDFTLTVLINCAALEQCCPQSLACFSTYIVFMSCLINSSRDVATLCGDGIITSLSYNDQNIANLFNRLGENVVFDNRECYLSTQFKEIEAYYGSNWATLKRTYFSSPWSFISVFSAFILLIFTAVQTITAILSYKSS